MIDLNEIRNDPNLIFKKLKRNFDFDEKFLFHQKMKERKFKF